MIYFYNESIATGTHYSVIHYIGSTNAPAPLMTNPTQACFINGAAANVVITLQAAVIPTPVNQDVTPLAGDWIDVQVFTNPQVFDALSLNGMWVRFKIVNSSGSPASVTCSLE